ncbi:MAG: hypothetical protein AB4041_15170 [Microcystaceae cyanobacterium]
MDFLRPPLLRLRVKLGVGRIAAGQLNYKGKSTDTIIQMRLISLIVPSIFWLAQIPPSDTQFHQLKQTLEGYDFQVLIKVPPIQGAYGLFNRDSRTIWINPIVFDLNIAMPTLIHESVHAAQWCAGNGEMTALGLDIQPISQARPFFRRYHDINRQDLEREAYAVQTQPNSLALALSLLDQHCQS